MLFEAAVSSAKGANATLALVSPSLLVDVWRGVSFCSQASDNWHSKEQEELG